MDIGPGESLDEAGGLRDRGFPGSDSLGRDDGSEGADEDESGTHVCVVRRWVGSSRRLLAVVN